MSIFSTGAQGPFLSLMSSIPTDALKPRAQPHFRTRGDRLLTGKLNAMGRPPAAAALRVTKLQGLAVGAILNRQNDSGDVFAVFDSVN